MNANGNSRRGELAPVVLLVFNRPRHTARVFDCLRAAKPKRLLVVADGPRRDRPKDADLCRETRRIVSNPDWPCELLTNFADENMGCRRRVSSGLDWVFGQVAEAIILEDDCIPVPSFFTFCTTLLDRYRNDPRVMSVAGSNFQLGRTRGSGSYYFSTYTHIWGWATWRRAWQEIDIELSSWPALREEGRLASVLRDPREIAYWTDIFDRVYDGQIDSWGYPWLFSCWSQSGLTAVPNKNLVTNVGTGPDATHTSDNTGILGIPAGELTECVHPRAVLRDQAADQFHWEEHILREILRDQKSRSWNQVWRKKLAIRTRIKRIFRQHSP